MAQELTDRCINGLDALPPQVKGCVLTIGNFDGVHVGHRQIVSVARELAARESLPVVAMTFEPPPDAVLRPADVPQRLTPPREKLRLLRLAGADWVVSVAAEASFFSMTPDQFIERIVRNNLSPRHMVEGPDFFYGCKRSGNVGTLAEEGRRLGFDVRVVEPVLLELGGKSQRVSSTLIRALVAGGKVEDAARCLARPYALYGDVVAGAGRGRVLEFPTANLAPTIQVVPAEGVYAGRAQIAGKSYPAAVSVGTKPTLGPAPLTVEAFLLDAKGDFYGQYMTLEFIARLRDQQRFDGMAALQAQISRDVQEVRGKVVGGRK